MWAAVAAPVFAAAGLVEHDEKPLAYADVMAHKFRDWNELLYSMRSIYAYAPWVRTIYVVTSGPTQVPAWLDASHPRVRVVHHAALFDDPATQLPTFNSYAIESVLHRIPGLSNRFLYFNQDFLLAQPVSIATWVQPAAAPGAPASSALSPLVPRSTRPTYLAFHEGTVSTNIRCRRAMEAAIAVPSAHPIRRRPLKYPQSSSSSTTCLLPTRASNRATGCPRATARRSSGRCRSTLTPRSSECSRRPTGSRARPR